ncbi:MAG: glycoside hydrolase family 130 protein [Opitutaceae bacterium]|jgi:predicted GH43/DUF377 family glycosyl hydrolase
MRTDLARRLPDNPLLRPVALRPSSPDLRVECLLNPGAFRFEGSVWLLVRVAERPGQVPGRVRFPCMEGGRVRVIDVADDDPDFDGSDPREFKYQGNGYLSTLSHLRLLRSEDGVRFEDTGRRLTGEGDQEGYGIEDCRVASLADGRFLLTYTAVGACGYGVGLRVTRDWRTFEHHGLILPPANKDCAIFDERVGGDYLALHRPSCVIVGGHDIWLARSPDLLHWGGHVCIARTRPGRWDEQRIGAGAAPLRTERGWLVVYHGADRNKRYCLGALLLDLDDPSRVISRSGEPIMEPLSDYERHGFFGEVVFTNGHVVDGDELTVYYGASDSVVCAARLSIREILARLPN